MLPKEALSAPRATASSLSHRMLLSLLPCPPTRWNAPSTLLDKPTPARRHPFLAEVRCPAALRGDEEEELAWLTQQAPALMTQLGEAGALHFVGFRLPTTKAGFRRWASALPLTPCKDPLTSIGVRKLLSSSDGVYEAVNAEALSKTFIGLHNDAT